MDTDEGTLESVPPCALDDKQLFIEGCTEDDVDMVCEKCSLVAGGNQNSDIVSGSMGDVGSVRPLLPILLPNWALETGTAERGFLVFSFSINRKPDASPNTFLMDLRILEARCILSHQMETKAGKFYIKARIQPTGTRNAVSSLSLDQLQPKFKLNPFSFSRSASFSSGRTPIRRAFRSPVFWHAITLEVRNEYMETGSYAHEFDSAVNASTRLAQQPNLELRLDLKEKGALRADDMYGANTTLQVPHWGNTQVLGSVHIPLGPAIWTYFIGQENRDSLEEQSTLIAEEEEQPVDNKSEYEGEQTQIGEPSSLKILRFVRRLEFPPDETESRGDLTIGMQYNSESTKLTLNPVKCSGIQLPRGTKSISLRAALVSNRKLLITQQSNRSARLTLNAAEFLLGERLEFTIEEQLSHVCLVLSVFARSGRKFSENVTLIGRCVTGPSGLAYGEGLSHWNAVCRKRGMIRRRHILF